MTACREHRIEAAVIRTVDEVRPVQSGTAVTVGPTRFTTLVGYRDGVVVRTVLREVPADLRGQLVAAGLRVRAVSDNLS